MACYHPSTAALPLPPVRRLQGKLLTWNAFLASCCHGSCQVSISHSTTPKLNTSLLMVEVPPQSTSGACNTRVARQGSRGAALGHGCRLHHVANENTSLVCPEDLKRRQVREGRVQAWLNLCRPWHGCLTMARR